MYKLVLDSLFLIKYFQIIPISFLLLDKYLISNFGNIVLYIIK